LPMTATDDRLMARLARCCAWGPAMPTCGAVQVSRASQVDVVPMATLGQFGPHEFENRAGLLEEVRRARDLDAPRMT
jgi:hypothetical protein